MSILIICSANRVRSPFVAALLIQRFAELELDSVPVTSAGTLATADLTAPDLASEVAQGYGLDLSNHRSRAVTRADVQHSSLVLTMTEAQRTAVQATLPVATPRVFTLKEFVRLRGNARDAYASLSELKALAEVAHRARPRQLPSKQPEDVEDPLGGSRGSYQVSMKELASLAKLL